METGRAFQELNTVYLEFDLGSDGDAGRKLSAQLLRLGAAPWTGETDCTVFLPLQLKDEFANYGLLSLRLLDELAVHPCGVRLKRVIAHAGASGQARTVKPA